MAFFRNFFDEVKTMIMTGSISLMKPKMINAEELLIKLALCLLNGKILI